MKISKVDFDLFLTFIFIGFFGLLIQLLGIIGVLQQLFGNHKELFFSICFQIIPIYHILTLIVAFVFRFRFKVINIVLNSYINIISTLITLVTFIYLMLLFDSNSSLNLG